MPLLPVTSYNTLLAAVSSLSEDVGTELSDYFPVAVDNAENRLTRELDFLAMDYISTPINVPSTNDTFTKPTGHKLTYFLKARLPSTGETFVLERKQEDYLTEYGGGLAVANKPRYYSDSSATSFRIAPLCTQNLEITVYGVRRPQPYLSASSQTNAFTTYAPDALLYAVMLELAIWQRNDALQQKYTELYVACRDSINNEGRRQRRDNGSPVNNPVSGRNTLLGDKSNQ